MQSLEYWLYAQIGLELVLAGAVGYFLVKSRSLSRRLASLAAADPGGAGKEEELAHKMAAWEKRLAAAEELIQALGTRLALLSASPPSMRAASEAHPRAAPRVSGASLRVQVEELFRQGLPPEEIARRLGLQLAEVKVALDLARVRSF